MIGGVIVALFFLIVVVVVIVVVSLVLIKLRRQRSVPTPDEEAKPQNGEDSKKALEAEEEGIGGIGGGQTFEMQSTTVPSPPYENVPVETPSLNTTTTSMFTIVIVKKVV